MKTKQPKRQVLFAKINLQSFHFSKCRKFAIAAAIKTENFGKLLCEREQQRTQYKYFICVRDVLVAVVMVVYIARNLSQPNANSGQFYWRECIENQSWIAAMTAKATATAAIATNRGPPPVLPSFVLLYSFSIFSMVGAIALRSLFCSLSFPFTFLFTLKLFY